MKYTVKFTAILIAFSLVLFAIIGLSIQIDRKYSVVDNSLGVRVDKGPKYNEFVDAYYYLLQNGEKSIFLQSEFFRTDPASGFSFFVAPDGVYYGQNQDPFYYTALEGKFDHKSGKLELNEDVKLKNKRSRLTANKAIYRQEESFFKATGNVKSNTINPKNGDRIFVDSELAYAKLGSENYSYVGDVKGKIRRKRVYELPIDFECDRFDLKMPESLGILTGAVQINRGELEAKAINGKIFLYNENRKLESFTLYDDVKIKEKLFDKSGKSFYRKAFAERLVGYEADRRMVLTGAPKVYQQGDVVRGNLITIRENVELIEIDNSNSVLLIKE